MVKRTSWFLVIFVGIGSVFWLSQNGKLTTTKLVGTGQAQGDRDSNPQVGGSSDSEIAGTVVPVSPRYAAGEMERHQQWKSGFAELEKAIRDQEDKVEERRKLLATIIRTKGLIYKGEGSPSGDNTARTEESIREASNRSMNAQDYVDAKKDFETDQQLLQEMRFKLISEKMKTKEEAGK